MVTRRSPISHRAEDQGPAQLSVAPARGHGEAVLVGSVVAASVAAAAALTVVIGLEPEWYGVAVRDVLAVARAGDPLTFYAGWVTYLGALGWFAAATAGVLTGLVLRGRAPRRRTSLLLWGGLVSLAMGVDDLFMFHDGVLAWQGVPEEATMAALGLAAAVWALTFLGSWARELTGLLLVAAGAWFAHSVLVDVLDVSLLVHEEASKLAAVLCWTAWFTAVSARELRRATAPAAR